MVPFMSTKFGTHRKHGNVLLELLVQIIVLIQHYKLCLALQTNVISSTHQGSLRWICLLYGRSGKDHQPPSFAQLYFNLKVNKAFLPIYISFRIARFHNQKVDIDHMIIERLSSYIIQSTYLERESELLVLHVVLQKCFFSNLNQENYITLIPSFSHLSSTYHHRVLGDHISHQEKNGSRMKSHKKHISMRRYKKQYSLGSYTDRNRQHKQNQSSLKFKMDIKIK